MADVLNYASPQPRRRTRIVFGWILCCVGILVSLHVAIYSIQVAWVLRHPPYNPEWAVINRDLSYFVPPFEAAIAAVCWLGCQRLRVGRRTSGIAVIMALVVWLCAIVSFP